MINLIELFEATPKAINYGLSAVLISLGVGVGYAISTANFVGKDEHGWKIERQAISTQEDLERALLLLNLQQISNEQLKKNVKQSSKKGTQNTEIVKDVERATSIVPKEEIEKLEAQAEQNRAVLLEE